MIRIARPFLVGTVAAGAVVAVVAASLPASSAPPLVPRMTASELAHGLLFNQGRAAHYLTVLDRPTIRMTRWLRIVQRSVDRKLKEHPVLAGTFARDVQSGDRVKVAAGLAILGRFTTQALASEFGRVAARRIAAQAKALLGSPALMTPNGGGSGSGQANVHSVVWVVVGLAVFFVLLTLGLILAFAAFRGAPDRLPAERIVNLVAISLKAAR